MRSPTPFSDAIPTPQTPTYSPVTLFRAFLHPCPRSAHSLGGSANLISGIWEMKGKEKKKKGPASWKSDREPSGAGAVARPLCTVPADGSLRPRRGDPGAPKQRLGEGEGGGRAWRRGRGARGPSPLLSSQPLTPTPFIYFFFPPKFSCLAIPP